MEKAQTQYGVIMALVQSAKEQLKHAVSGQHQMEALSKGTGIIEQIERENSIFNSLMRQLDSGQEQLLLPQVVEIRTEIQLLKTQFGRIRDHNMASVMSHNTPANASEMQKLDDQAMIAKTLVKQGNISLANGTQELQRQNAQTDELLVQNQRITKNAVYAKKLAEFIRCNERKHMLLQVNLLIGIAVLLVAGLIVGLPTR